MGLLPNTSMAQCRTAVSPLRKQWGYCSLALSHRLLLETNYTTYYSAVMKTSSNGNIFRVTGPLCGNPPVTGGFPSQRPVTRRFEVFFDLCLSKQLSKPSRRRWFETPPHWLWRHYNNILVEKPADPMGWICPRVQMWLHQIISLNAQLMQVCKIHVHVLYPFYSTWNSTEIKYDISIPRRLWGYIV